MIAKILDGKRLAEQIQNELAGEVAEFRAAGRPTPQLTVAQGRPRFFPCTPYGIQQLLMRNGIETAGRHAVIVGRSDIVGKPMALMLMQRGPGGDATVTVCHSRTPNLGAITRQADILIVAI